MTATEFQTMCVTDIEKRMSLPDEDWYQQTQDSVLFTYINSNGKKRFMTITEREKVAQLMEDHGLIEDFTGERHQTKMYQLKVHTEKTPGPKQEPLQTEYLCELEWHEITFTRREVLRFCAEYEYELTCVEAGIPNRGRMTGVVRRLQHKFTNIFRAA